MAITIPALTSVNDILDTDLVMVTHSEGSSFKISGAELKKNFDIIIAQGTTVSGPGLHAGSTIRIYFSTTLMANNASTALVINYNNVNVTVKAPKDGSLIDYVAKAVGNSYVYCQAHTTLELLYNGTNFVIIGNPVVISNADYSIYTDGLISYKDYLRNVNIFQGAFPPDTPGQNVFYSLQSVIIPGTGIENYSAFILGFVNNTSVNKLVCDSGLQKFYNNDTVVLQYAFNQTTPINVRLTIIGVRI